MSGDKSQLDSHGGICREGPREGRTANPVVVSVTRGALPHPELTHALAPLFKHARGPRLCLRDNLPALHICALVAAFLPFSAPLTRSIRLSITLIGLIRGSVRAL